MNTDKDIRGRFRAQSLACNALGSPFTSRVCNALAEHLREEQGSFASRIMNWQGNLLDDALALRAAGALNALARNGAWAELTAAYPPHEADDGMLWSAIEKSLGTYDAFLDLWLNSPPQTNEVARSGSLLGGALHLAAATGLPVDLYEIGSSAGLNLSFDRYHYDFKRAAWGSEAEGVNIVQDWSGNLPPVDAPLAIRHRRGCDQNPLDPSSDDHRTRLLAYVWPDQSARIARLTAALDSTARSGVRVEKADAADWVEKIFAAPVEAGVTRLLSHSITWQYLSEAVKARIKAAMEKAGRAATADAPVAWLRVEPDGTNPYATVRLTIWPSGETRDLGKADFHGRFTIWD